MPEFDLGVNLADPDTFASGFPHEVFRDLRRAAPVYWHARGHERGGKGFFVVSKYEDVKYVGRTPQIYSCADERLQIRAGDRAQEHRRRGDLEMHSSLIALDILGDFRR